MKPHSSYLPVESNAPLRGLATSHPATRIPPEFSPDLLNVLVRDGVVRRRSGYLQLGALLFDTAFTITVADSTNDHFTIAGAQSSSFTVGQKFEVLGSTGNDATWVVKSISEVAGPNTEIFVTGDITSAVADGVIRIGGPVLGLTEFAPIGDVEKLVAFTGKRQFYFDNTNNRWVDISKEQTTSRAIDAVVTGTPSFAFAAGLGDVSAHFPAGAKFVVEGSTGNNGIYTVDSVAGGPPTVITTVETMPDSTADGNIHAADRDHAITGASIAADRIHVAGDQTAVFTPGLVFHVRGSTANDGAWTVHHTTLVAGPTTYIFVVEDVTDNTADGDCILIEDLSFTEGYIIDYQAITDTNGRRLLMTNGVNNPLQWTGETGTYEVFLRWAPLYANFVTCDSLAVFKEHLFLGGVQTASDEPQVVAWSDAGDFHNYLTGTSGVQILYDLATGIQGMKSLGDRLIIYSNDAIVNGIFVGLPFVFGFETVIPEGTRLVSPNSIVSINVGHVYASQENFYLFDGTRGLRTLSDIIRSDYKVAKDHDYLYQCCSLNDYAKRTVFVAFPDSATSGIIYTMEYDAFNLAQRRDLLHLG
jgi:hypothetical protein